MCVSLRSSAGPTIWLVSNDGWLVRLSAHAVGTPWREPDGLIGHWASELGQRLVRFQRTQLDLSAASIESDGDLAAVHDHRDRPPALGVVKHLLHPRGVPGDVDVLEGDLPFAVLLTGGRGIGSGVLAEDQHSLSHRVRSRVGLPCQSTAARSPSVIRVNRPS